MSAARSSCQANPIQFQTVFMRRGDAVVGGGASAADVGRKQKWSEELLHPSQQDTCRTR